MEETDDNSSERKEKIMSNTFKLLSAYLVVCLCVLIIPLKFTEFDYSSVLFAGSVFMCSISIFSILKKFNKFSILRAFFLILPSIFYILYLVPISTNFRKLTTDDIMAVLQTNIHEGSDYLADNIHVGWLLILISILIIFIYLAIKQNKCLSNIIRNAKMALVCFVIGISLMWFYRENSFTKPIYEVVPKIQEYRHFYSELKRNKQLDVVKKDTQKGIYVVVIGESQNRNRMSVYGYADHETTPYLSQMKQNKNWFFLDNVYSCHTHTIPVLTYALTQKNTYNDMKLGDAYSIMDVLHEFNTYWISNQKAVGYYGEPITEIGMQAKKSIFINKSFVKTDPYDVDLLKELPDEKDLQDTSVIFIHLMGNHGSYVHRYPKGFGKWSDYYDNSMLYNDYIVQKIYEHFASMKDFMAFMYFADHADDPRCKCHDASGFTWAMTKIPLYVSLSDNYINNHEQKDKALKEHLHTPFTNDMVFDTVLGILDITDERFYVPENDLSSMKYNHTREDLKTLHGRKPLTEEKETNDNWGKFWLHRVNSPQKLGKLGHKYAGLEMDIIYYSKENDFENSHSAQSLELYSLEKTLEMYKKKGNKQSLWFDFKNLNDSNKVKAEKRLSELIKKYGITKDNVWVESKDYDALDYFTQNGWRTSYYVPYYDFEKMSAAEIEDAKKQIEKISFSGKVKAISFAWKYYYFIKKLKLNKEISLLTWFSQDSLASLKKREDYSVLMKDPQLKVILVKELGRYHR